MYIVESWKFRMCDASAGGVCPPGAQNPVERNARGGAGDGGGPGAARGRAGGVPRRDGTLPNSFSSK